MKRSSFNVVLILMVLLMSIIFGGCKKESKAKANDINYDAKYIEYISDYTTGTISRRSKVAITLVNPVDSQLISINNKGQLPDGVLSITPSVKGRTMWDSDRRIVFHPDTAFDPGKAYKVKLDLKKLYPGIQDDLSFFEFGFLVIRQDFTVTMEDIKFYSENGKDYQQISGFISTADAELSKDIEQIIAVDSIEWDHDGQVNMHRFTVRGLERKTDNYQSELTYDGSRIGISKKGKIPLVVYGLDGFNFVDFKVVSSEGDNSVELRFSKELDRKQNIKDIITVNDKSTRKFLIDGNKIVIYLENITSNTIKITFDKTLKDSSGKQLSEPIEIMAALRQEKPQIKFLDDKGGILPGSQGFIVPFSAISLKAVDVTVVEIFENNMTQFFQSNSTIAEKNYIARVGRPVVYKTVPLNTKGLNLYQWNRFNIDLTDFVKTRKGALYQIRINFRKSQSLYSCKDSSDSVTHEDEMLKDNFDAPDENSYWDYYYYEDDWAQRDNPCSDSFYGKRREISKNILASDIGIIVKGSDNLEYSVFVTDLKTTELLSGVEVEFYNFQNQIILSGKTDGNGKFTASLSMPPFMISAKKGKERGFIKVDGNSALTLSRFDVGGTNSKRGIKGYIYGDRGVWRPGDTVYLNFILLDREKILPVGHPVVFELLDPNGKIQQRITRNSSTGNIYNFTFKTSSDAVTGNYQANIRVGGETFTKTIKIETVKPNRLKIDLNFGKDALHIDDGSISAKIKANWLHGAPASNMKAEVSVIYGESQTTFKQYPGFTFDNPTKQFYPEETVIFEGTLNQEGNTEFRYAPSDLPEAKGMLIANFISRVREDGGDYSIDKLVIPYHPYSKYVGLRLPPGDAARGMLLTDQDHKVEIVSLDSYGNPVSIKDLEVSVYKLQWRWWWDTSYEDRSTFTSSNYHKKVAFAKISTNNGKGEYKLKINHPEWGRYFVQVLDPVSGHSSGQIVFIDWPGWAGASQRGDEGGENILSFYADKQEYKIGEVAKFTIPSTPGGRALVNIESGTRTVDSFWVATTKGKTEFSFTVNKKMSPNVYVHLTLVQAHNNDNDLPIRLYGVVPIGVIDDSTVLKPVIKISDTLAPEKEVRFEVTESSGKPMSYTVAIVDEGLLNLTNFKTPEPWKSFYAKEAIGIRTWDIFDDVLGAQAKIFGPLLTIGGGGEFTPPTVQRANRFEPVVRFFGPFKLNANSKGSHSFVMPRYVGAVRTMVVAENNGAYGNVEKTSFVKDSLMVIATMPRVAGPQEKIKLPVNIFMLDEGKHSVSVKVKTEGLLNIVGDTEKTLEFDRSGDKFLYFDLTTADKLGVGKVIVNAVSGKSSASYEVNINVRASNPLVRDTTTLTVEPGHKVDSMIKTFGIAGTNGVNLELSYLKPVNLTGRLDYLINYPHGCLEQTVSGVFPQLFLAELTNLDKKRSDEVEANINAGIERINNFRTSEGGFAYWPGKTEVSSWATNYAGHFLVIAAEKGFAVSDMILSEWSGYQTAAANRWRDNGNDDDDMNQAYRLYTLALYNKPVHSAMNRMKDKKNMDFRARWILASAYAVSGNTKIAEEIVRDLNTTVSSYMASSQSFGSAERDKAMILETLVLLGRKNEGLKIYEELAEILSSDAWLSTQTAAYSLIALSKYASVISKDQLIKAEYSYGNDAGVVDAKEVYWTKSLNPQNANLSITNRGPSLLFAKIINMGIPIAGTEMNEEKNIKMEISYRSRNGDFIDDISSLRQGTTIIVEISVIHTGMPILYEELALTNIVPSGWEILNSRVQDVDSFKNYSDFDFQDIRDDRVLTYFKLKPGEVKMFRFMINASYTGSFYYPGINLEAMYNGDVYSRKPGKSVSVVK